MRQGRPVGGRLGKELEGQAKKLDDLLKLNMSPKVHRRWLMVVIWAEVWYSQMGGSWDPHPM